MTYVIAWTALGLYWALLFAFAIKAECVNSGAVVFGFPAKSIMSTAAHPNAVY